jgi:hypothetical protein
VKFQCFLKLIFESIIPVYPALFSTSLDDSVDRVIHESVALNRSHDSLVNGGTDGYGREESGAESDEAFSDWDSCEELMLVCTLQFCHVKQDLLHTSRIHTFAVVGTCEI